MDADLVACFIDKEIYHQTQKHLTDLQEAVVVKVWQGKKYHEIADEYGCTEGHAKDTGALLWKLLSQAWGKKVTKSNFRSLSKGQFKSLEQRKTNPGDNLAGLEDCPVKTNSSFLGRQNAIATLQDLINQNHKVIVIQGKGGIGKTTLAQNFLANQGFELTLEVLMAKETENIISVTSVVEEWLQRDLNQEAGKEFGVTLARLKRYLEQHRIGILIDNLEPALDKDGRFISTHRNYEELLRILGDPKVQSTTIITSRDRLCEAEINLEHFRLSGLDLSAWSQYFVTHQIKPENQALSQIHLTYGGNAKAMGLLCGIIQEDYQKNIEQYWQDNCHDPLVEIDLKNLVSNQFDRLQELDPEAYGLLCRMGCYRYQDIPKVSQAALLCLLWDVPSKKQRRVIRSIQNRSLLEFAQGEYWLHPIVQGEARFRLQKLPHEWQQTHRQIANFLTSSVDKINSIREGLTALEAYYHHVEIQDNAAAAKVILQSRENQWGQFLTLGTTLCRLGVIQPLLIAINHILTKVKHDRHRSELNNILGDLYWTTGKVHQAIACQDKTIITSQNCLELMPRVPENKHDLYYWRMLEVDSLLSLGLYNIDLWELNTAKNLFQRVIKIAHNTQHHSWSEKASLGLALIYSHQQSSPELQSDVTRIYRLIVDLEDPTYNTGRFAYFMQVLGQIFFNLQQIEPAKIMWSKAIAFSKSSHYTQIEAKSLIGLGNIKRYVGELETAAAYHQQAAELLDQISAKCDLAEAYFQWGITLQAKEQTAKAKNHFATAIKLYEQISAPNQVERVQKAIA